MNKIDEIVAEYLIVNDYDGLCMPDMECGCGVDDLRPCGECLCLCEPAYKHSDGLFYKTVGEKQ